MEAKVSYFPHAAKQRPDLGPVKLLRIDIVSFPCLFVQSNKIIITMVMKTNILHLNYSYYISISAFCKNKKQHKKSSNTLQSTS